jgi:hypothetical protein
LLRLHQRKTAKQGGRKEDYSTEYHCIHPTSSIYVSIEGSEH